MSSKAKQIIWALVIAGLVLLTGIVILLVWFLSPSSIELPVKVLITAFLLILWPVGIIDCLLQSQAKECSSCRSGGNSPLCQPVMGRRNLELQPGRMMSYRVVQRKRFMASWHQTRQLQKRRGGIAGRCGSSSILSPATVININIPTGHRIRRNAVIRTLTGSSMELGLRNQTRRMTMPVKRTSPAITSAKLFA